MPGIIPLLDNALTHAFKNGGITNQVNIISYTIASGTYDDRTSRTLTGSVIVSGLIFPVDSVQGSQEALLLEQGKLLTKDKILFTGSFNTSGNLLFQIGGSGTNNDWFTLAPPGIQTWEAAGSTVFNKIYLRHTIPGSLF